MMINYKFSKQIKNRGCYGEITFDYQVTSLYVEPKIEYTASPEWEMACRLGVLIFCDYIAKKSDYRLLEINISEVKWLPVDTNHLIVLYTTIKALSHTFDISIEGLTFDEHQEKFIFPETRSL